MNSLNEITKIYSQYKLRTPYMTQVIVDDRTHFFINYLLLQSRNLLKSNIEHKNIGAIDYELRSLIYSIGTTLSPLNQIIKEEQFILLLETLELEYSHFIHKMSIINQLINNLNFFYKKEEHSYEIGLEKILIHTSRKYTIVSKRILNVELKEKLKREYNNFTIEFKVYTDFIKDIKAYDVVVFIGSPNIYSETVLNHINGNHFYYLYFKCYHKKIVNTPWIEHDRIHSFLSPIKENTIEITEYHTSDIQMINADITEEVFELSVEPDLPDYLISTLISDGESRSDTQYVKCKLIELDDGEFVFEEIGPKAKCDVLTTNFIFQRKHVNEIKLEEYMVLMDFHSWEDRRRLADKYFEKKGIIKDRKKLDKLKEFMSKKITKYGLEEYTNTLNNELNLSLKPYQILGLTKKESFKLQNDDDFLKILKFICKTDEIANKYLAICKKLSSFHNRLGRIVRKELREYLKKNSNVLENVDSEVEIIIPNIEAIKIEISKVKRISESTYEVPTNRAGIPIYLHQREVI